MRKLVNLLLLMMGLFLASCVDVAQLSESSGTAKRATSSTNSGSSNNNANDATPAPPDLATSLNFFQKVDKEVSGFIDIEHDYDDILFLRGTQVNEFLQSTQNFAVHCMISVYPNSTGNEVVVTALIPQSATNYAEGRLEYFFRFNPNSDESTIQCSNAAITNYITGNYASYTSTNLLKSACPNCSSFNLNSSEIVILNTSATPIGPQSIDVAYLGVSLKTRQSAQIGDSFLSCTSNSSCTAKDFDCCSEGQCVNDKTLKSGVDLTDPDYLQALADIEMDPNNIYNYRQYYHLCGSVVNEEPDPEPLPDPQEEVLNGLLSKKELYDCTTPSEGELAYCTITYLNASQAGTTTFYTSEDDRNFNSVYYGTTGIPTHSIDEVTYAGETLYDNGAIISGMTIGPLGNGTGNDNLTDRQQIDISHTPGNNAPNDTLKIRYKIDGSCEKLSSRLARCYKEYVQGQNLGQVDDHFPVSNQFHMPHYADTNRNVVVEVDGVKKENVIHYTLQGTASPPYVEFPGGTTTMSIFNDQKVKLTYYVDLTTYPNLMVQKEAALESIKSICQCNNTDCRFSPKIENGSVIDYICDYPDSEDNAPLFKVVALDTRTIPHRFFDTNGLHHTNLNGVGDQEGNEFEYTNNDLLKPNNISQYIGFNEIYGTLNTYTGVEPAQEVEVVKNKSYDIFVDNGVYSTCLQCGNDYFNNLLKLFPDSFPFDFGGGHRPNQGTDVFSSPENREYRRDDLLFGRACWVPATMIPWTHRGQSDPQTQRLDRLSAQHFMYANGYQRDWYGFDYGSVIGSFDGVLWFSIGNKRKITAKSNKLYLAVNAPFADLAVVNSFQVTIQDSVTTIEDNVLPSSNIETTGAECQKHHLCDTDQDCAAQLGWDYSCESVSGLTSPWPSFDSSATEIPGDEQVFNLASLFTTGGGTTKRCVYRGRGALCIGGYETSDPDNTFTGTTTDGLHACSNNNYCQQFEDGSLVDKFNTKISRYGKSVPNQNVNSDGTFGSLDYIGLHSRTIGRPHDWNGTDEIPSTARSNLTSNKVFSMCIPGRDPADNTLLETHRAVPLATDDGDKINGMGVTPSGTATDEYYSSCSVFGSDGNYLYKSQASNTLLSNSAITNLAGNQAISTNALSIFESSSLTDEEITKNFNAEQIDELYFEENRCLRAPGSTCFSNMDCAANTYFVDKVSVLDSESATVQALINKYEVQFWQEELVCSQADAPGDEDYDLKNNKCCRETNNIITVATATFSPGGGTVDVDTTNLPGLTTNGIGLNDPLRYSRMSTIWDLRTGVQAANHPVLQVQEADACPTGGNASCGDVTNLDQQYNTLSAIGERTCCSGHWVREFSDSNGRGHKWGPEKLQTIPVESFRCYNWSQCSGGTCGSNFTCDHTDSSFDPSCRIKTTFPESAQARAIFGWLETLELTGIPQIAIKTSDFSDIQCNVDPNIQSFAAGGQIPPNIIKEPGAENAEYDDASNDRLYSAADEDNLNTDNLKTVFSPDKLSCCLPPGTEVERTADPNICCTGFIAAGPGGKGICQLQDFTNLSVFFNRYVSSAAKDEPLGNFDQETGYLNPGAMTRLICDKNACASGHYAPGVVISTLRVPGHESKAEEGVIRFLDGYDPSNNFSGIGDLYDEGLRWNHHYYCVPQEYEGAIPCNTP